MKICSGCVWYSAPGGNAGSGECMVDPPKVLLVPEDIDPNTGAWQTWDVHSERPSVAGDDFCSRWNEVNLQPEKKHEG